MHLENVLSVYDGREHLGDLVPNADGFLAFEPDGKQIGQFASRQQAERAVSAAAKARA